MKTYHEWGYRFPADDISELTTRQQRLIQVAEAAESYIQQIQMDRSETGSSTRTAQVKRDHKASIRQRTHE